MAWADFYWRTQKEAFRHLVDPAPPPTSPGVSLAPQAVGPFRLVDEFGTTHLQVRDVTFGDPIQAFPGTPGPEVSAFVQFQLGPRTPGESWLEGLWRVGFSGRGVPVFGGLSLGYNFQR